MEMIDVHAHLTDEKFDDINDVVTRAIEAGVQKIICSACDFVSSEKVISLAEKYESVYAVVGVHPENVDDFDEVSIKKLEKLAQNKKVVAIGEIGLDYYMLQFL